MKKSKNVRFSVFILSALIFCLLTGCGTEPAVPAEPACQHQWSEADCLSAAVCSLCGEAQDEALGHDWVEADCETAKHCSRCGETQGEALGHSYGKWLLDETSMYQVCANCQQTVSAEIDYPLYLEQHIYGRWNLCSMIKNGRYLDSYWLPQDEVDPEYCFYEDGRVSSIGFEETEVSPSWSFDRGEYDSANFCHKIYISFPGDNALSSAYFSCFGDSITYEIPLNDKGDMITLSNSFGNDIAALLNGTWSTWSDDGLFSITFSEDRSFTADIDGEISGFWQPRQSPTGNNAYSGSAQLMLNYIKDGKETSGYAMFDGFNPGYSQELQKENMRLSTYVNDTYSNFGLDAKEFLTEAVKSADSAHLGTWTSIDYIVSTPNYETYSSDEEKGLSTDYSITFMEDGTFSAKLHNELEGSWSLREVRRENGGVCLMYWVTAPGINEYSYFQMYENGDGYLYISNTDNRSANYSFRQMNEKELAAQNELMAAAPTMIVGEWFSTDGQSLNAVFNEDGTFLISSGAADAQSETKGNWYFNSMSDYQTTYSYIYDLETVFDIELPEDAEATTDTVDIEGALDAAAGALDAESAEPVTYREDYALRLMVKDGLYTLEISSLSVNGTLTNAEGLAAREEAAKAIAGHWSAGIATEYNINSGDSKEVADDFYLDIAEDGSISGYAGQDILGTIEYYDSEDGSRRYLVHFEAGPDMDAMFILSGDSLAANIRPYLIDFSK